jgi:hypothetical protein
MSHIKKSILIPAELQEQRFDNQHNETMDELTNDVVKKKKIRQTVDRIKRIMKIILKLAKINGYDTEGRVLNDEGNYVENSNILTLLNHAMTKGRILIGQSDFISILHKASVEPDLIVNENVRSKLLSLYNDKRTVDHEYNKFDNQSSIISDKNKIPFTNNEFNEPDIIVKKRRRENDSEIEDESPLKKTNWEVNKKKLLFIVLQFIYHSLLMTMKFCRRKMTN